MLHAAPSWAGCRRRRGTPPEIDRAHVESETPAPTLGCPRDGGVDITRRTNMGRAQKITTYLWFDGNAEEAVEHYTSLFPDSRVTKVARWGKGGPAPEGSVMNMGFELAGQSFIALNGGPQYKFTAAISLFVSCESQEEVDTLWARLLAAGGKE